MRAERKVGEGNTWKTVESLLTSSLNKKLQQKQTIDTAIALWNDNNNKVDAAVKAENIRRLQPIQSRLGQEADAFQKSTKRNIAEALTLDMEDKDNDWLAYARQHMHVTLQRPTIVDLGKTDEGGKHVADLIKEHEVRVKAYADDPNRFTFKCVRHAHVAEDGTELKSHKKRWDQRGEGAVTMERHNQQPEGARHSDNRRSYRVYYGHETEADARAVHEMELAQNPDSTYWEPVPIPRRGERN